MTSKSVYWGWLLSSKARERWGQPLWDNQPPAPIPCACTLRDLRLSLCWIYSHSFLSCFSLLGNFTKVRAHQTSYSVLVSLR